jgi:hypothetical protein
MNLDVPCTLSKITASGGEDESRSGSKEFCAVVKLPAREAPALHEQSSSRACEQESKADAVLLLGMNTRANIGDLLEVEGVKLRVTHVEPERDVVGKLDHYRIEAIEWSDGDFAGDG